MTNRNHNRSILSAFLLVLMSFSCCCRTWTMEWQLSPSENKGRMGQYTVSTPIKECNYHVYVPQNYSDDKPAGIFIFVHGTGSAADNKNFRLSKIFLDNLHMIGIHMQFLDGRPSVNCSEKIKASEYAVAQVQEDYKIIPGRGVISSFSEGGYWQHMYFNVYKDKMAPDKQWPFMHHHVMSANWSRPTADKTFMSYYIACGNPKKPGGGDNGIGYMNPLYAMTIKAETQQTFYSMSKNQGHAPYKEDFIESVEQFKIIDVIKAPFLYEPDWSGKELAQIAAQANVRNFQTALKALEKVEGNKTTNKEKARLLKGKIEQRINEVCSMANELLLKDIILTENYMPIILKQLGSLPQGKILADSWNAARKSASYKRAIELNYSFRNEFVNLMGINYKKLDYGVVYDQYIPLLRECVQVAGEKSQLGKMAVKLIEFTGSHQ